MRYRAEIDGLRALAIVPVVLYHAGFPVFGGGFVGVDVFFVISGYLITTIIAEDLAKGRFSLWDFYLRRARRILPALLLVMLVSLPFCWAWMMPRDLVAFSKSLLAVLTFTSNFYFWQETGYFETTAHLQPLLHSWSLAVEEQFYILFPFLMLLIWRRGPGWILAGLMLVSLVLAEWALEHDAGAAFFLLPFRAWELLAGASVALYLRHRTAPLLAPFGREVLAGLGVLLIAGAVLGVSGGARFPGVAALPPVIGTVLVILFAREGGWVCRALAAGPLVRVGLISYGFYLWHQPVFALVTHRFGPVAFADWAGWLILLAFLLALLGHRFVEEPFRRRVSAKMLGLSIGVSVIVVIGFGLVIHDQADDHPRSVPSFTWALKHADPELLRYVERKDVRMACGAEDALGVSRCSFGAAAAKPTLVLWGDSLAGALLHGMDRMAREKGLAGVAFIANGCPPILGLSNARVPTCAGATHEAILTRIEALDGITDAVITGNMAGAISAGNVSIDGEATAFGLVRDRLSRAVARLHDKAVRVILLEQGPTFGEDVSNYLLQNLRLGLHQPLTLGRADVLESLREARALADVPDLYVETADVFCPTEVCPSVDAEGRLVIFDHNHVTRLYSERLAGLVARVAGF